MKKGLIGGIIFAGVLVLSGCGAKPTTKVGVESPKGTANVATDEGNGLLDTAEKIKNAMLGGKKMECVFKDDSGDGKQIEMKMQSQGEKFRSSYNVKGEDFVSVSDGKVIYSWSSKTKEGQKMDIKCMEDLSKDTPQTENVTGNDNTDFETPEELVAKEPDMKCSPIANIDFSVPSDVKFTDTCAEMKKVFESMKDLNVNLPKGVGFPAPTTE